ncbi:MAG: hypothetical protein HZB64_03800 [Rhodocyclales bacterium]|nr:hypothetical protein [Rhodocyclales bacterium]
MRTTHSLAPKLDRLRNICHRADMTTHMLDKLRSPTHSSVLFCGAGLSVGAVPGAAKLYEQEYENVERKLNIGGTIDHAQFAVIQIEARLYAWADAVLDELEKRGEALPKLRFAEALGLLTDPRWWDKAEIDFRGNGPRHRVIARFAKEGLLHSIWSFNWDCILENALEQIGLPGVEPRFKSPWEKYRYATHVHSHYFPYCKDTNVLNIHKPHGCVRALREARDAEGMDHAKADALSYRLMVGARELCDRRSCTKAVPEDDAFFDAMGDDVRNAFNLVIGWSMGEASLKKKLLPCIQYQGTTLAIVDPAFSSSHLEICQAAGLQQKDVHFKLEVSKCPNRDDVFLWQQALYSLERLEAENGDNPILDKQGTNWRLAVFPCAANFLMAWADEFLPTWTRLCWSAGLVVAKLMPSHRIDLERRDEYIPLNYRHVERPDLQAAIRLLNAIPALGEGFDAEGFPGGLFHKETGTLVIPLPCWGDLNELRALRPMVDALRGNLGYVERIAVWPIGSVAECSERGEALRQSLSAIMPVPSFADPSHIRLINDLNEVSQ